MSLASQSKGDVLTRNIDALFTRERALQRWVALRGALTFLNIACNEAQQTSYTDLVRVASDTQLHPILSKS
jgi:hypothetical protein